MGDDEIRNDPGYQEWERSVREELIPKLESSGAAAYLVPTGEVDIKFAVELGLGIMMDKPILAVVQPGAHVPERLARVADQIFEVDLTTQEGRDNLGERISAFTIERGLE